MENVSYSLLTVKEGSKGTGGGKSVIEKFCGKWLGGMCSNVI